MRQVLKFCGILITLVTFVQGTPLPNNEPPALNTHEPTTDQNMATSPSAVSEITATTDESSSNYVGRTALFTTKTVNENGQDLFIPLGDEAMKSDGTTEEMTTTIAPNVEETTLRATTEIPDVKTSTAKSKVTSKSGGKQSEDGSTAAPPETSSPTNLASPLTKSNYVAGLTCFLLIAKHLIS